MNAARSTLAPWITEVAIGLGRPLTKWERDQVRNAWRIRKAGGEAPWPKQLVTAFQVAERSA